MYIISAYIRPKYLNTWKDYFIYRYHEYEWRPAIYWQSKKSEHMVVWSLNTNEGPK